jgi:DNA-binding response OmpR family regulator
MAGLADAVWENPDTAPLDLKGNISVHIAHLRRSGIDIRTAHGRGYHLGELRA